MIDAAKAIQIITDRKLSLRPTRDNLWVAETATGTRLHREPQSTPLLAIELAEQTMLLSEQKRSNPDSDKLVASLGSGKFYIKPRQLESGAMVFDSLYLDGSIIFADSTTVQQAVSSTERILDEKRETVVKTNTRK